MEKQSAKQEFLFRVTYFLPDGKFCQCVPWYTKVRYKLINDGTTVIPIMSHVVARLRGLRDSGGQEGMPGQFDEGWEGPIHIVWQEDHATARIILPCKD